MNFNIRPYKSDDKKVIYDICLKTGNDGKDASCLFTDHKLIGHYYAASYVELEPESAFILTLDNNPVGYIIGTKDTSTFNKKSEELWFPKLRGQYKLPDEEANNPDARLIRLIHKGYTLKKEFVDYPAHLHIDILPKGQGKGQGKKLMEFYMDYLKSNNVKGLHLEVSTVNAGAVKFYENIGFKKLVEYEYSIGFGIVF